MKGREKDREQKELREREMSSLQFVHTAIVVYLGIIRTGSVELFRPLNHSLLDRLVSYEGQVACSIDSLRGPIEQ